jgi:hypothetical protein
MQLTKQNIALSKRRSTKHNKIVAASCWNFVVNYGKVAIDVGKMEKVMYIFNRGGRVLCSDWLELISMEKMEKMNFLVHHLLFNV